VRPRVVGRPAIIVMIMGVLLGLSVAPAAAHGGGPDVAYYRTQLTDVVSRPPGVRVRVDPAGEWIELTSTGPETVIVLGYLREPGSRRGSLRHCDRLRVPGLPACGRPAQPRRRRQLLPNPLVCPGHPQPVAPGARDGQPAPRATGSGAVSCTAAPTRRISAADGRPDGSGAATGQSAQSTPPNSVPACAQLPVTVLSCRLSVVPARLLYQLVRPRVVGRPAIVVVGTVVLPDGRQWGGTPARW
jgi:hypothetical protein